MAINFPSSPSVNDTHSVGNTTYTWNGSSWDSGISYAGSGTLTISGASTLTGIYQETIAAGDATESGVTDDEKTITTIWEVE